SRKDQDLTQLGAKRATQQFSFFLLHVSWRLLDHSREKAAWIHMTRDFVLSAPHRDDNTVRRLGDRPGARLAAQKRDQPAHRSTSCAAISSAESVLIAHSTLAIL